MKVRDLFEDKEEKNLLPVDQIAMLLFKKKAGIVKDPKRDKDKNYLGVAHSKSVLKAPNGRAIHLTFDNSTDSGDFEIDSFTSLKIEKGGEIDKAIKKLFAKHELDTKKTVGYVVKSEAAYVRELHLGKKLGRPAVKLVSDLIKLLKPLGGEDQEEPTEDDAKKDATEKKAPPKEEPEEKEPPKEEPKDPPKEDKSKGKKE